MTVPTKRERAIIVKVEDCVCDFFNVELDDIIEYNYTKTPSVARKFICFILHNDFGLSIGKISDSFSRTQRSVKMQIAYMRSFIEHDIVFKDKYEKLIEKIKGSN